MTDTKQPINQIVVCSDIKFAVEQVKERFGGYKTTVFPKNAEEGDISMESAHEMLKEAYLTSDEMRVFIIGSMVYRQEVQNKLLKTLEEPPPQVSFVLICKTKSALLPTVRSRLPISYLRTEKRNESFDAKLQRLDHKQLFDLLKYFEKMPRDEAEGALQQLFAQYADLPRTKASQNTKELESFEKALYLLRSNTRPGFVFATLLSHIASRKRS